MESDVPLAANLAQLGISNGEMQMMRKPVTRGVPLVLFCLAVGVAAAQSVHPSFNLKLSPGKPEFRVGEDVYIEIIQNSLTNQEIDCSYVGGGGVNYRYFYNVSDENGHDAERVARLVPPLADYHGCGIKPGESSKNTIVLSAVYKFDRPGRYTVQVWRWDTVEGENGDDLKVWSNSIEIRISG